MSSTKSVEFFCSVMFTKSAVGVFETVTFSSRFVSVVSFISVNKISCYEHAVTAGIHAVEDYLQISNVT